MSKECHLEKTGRVEINQGLADIEQFADAKMPVNDFNITAVLGDIIMAEFDDCNEDGNEIYRDGIWLNIDMTRSCWRSAKVLLVGPNTCKTITVGSRIAFPNDRGIKTIQTNDDGSKKNIIFLNEERVFGVLAPKEDVEDGT